MAGARDSFADAEQAMFDAQQRVLTLQEKLGVLDPLTEQQGLMTQITGLETQLSDKRLQLEQLLDNARPNQARVDGARGDIRRLEDLIAELRAQLAAQQLDSTPQDITSLLDVWIRLDILVPVAKSPNRFELNAQIHDFLAYLRKEHRLGLCLEI